MIRLCLALSLLAAPLGAQEVQGWDLLAGAGVSEAGAGADLRLVKTFPPELVAAAEDFTISGYLVPVLAEPFIDSFLLVPDPADCPFCGNGGYGPSLEVDMKRALPDLPEGTYLALQGRLQLNHDSDSYDLFRLIDAVRVDPGG